MATCSRCKQPIEDSATSCPHCGAPVVKTFHVDLSPNLSTVTEEPSQKTPTRVQKMILGLLVATFATILMIYFVLMPYIDEQNALRTAPPPAPVELPWIDRAMDMARQSFGTEAIAAPIVQTLYTRPETAGMDKLDVQRDGDDIVTVFTISWVEPGKDGNHILQVTWRCNEQQHVGVEVTKTDMDPPSADDLARLDEMIAKQLYGAMKRVK